MKKIAFARLVRSLFALLATLLVLAYPYIVYRMTEHDGPVWSAPLFLALFYVYQAVRIEDRGRRLKKFGVAIALVVGAVFLQSITAKLIPVMIQLLLFVFFGRTLVHGPPLIERFVRLDYPVFPPGISEYCRQLTQVWTGYFGFNTLVCAGLAIWAPASWWALYTGCLIFVLMVVLMVGEYVYRHWRFPELEIPDPASTMKSMISHGRNIWMDVHAH